jgi:NADP-dependent 3-hydroxy acid dehydrogenase YdfG
MVPAIYIPNSWNNMVTMVEAGAAETEPPDYITDEEAREGLSNLLEELARPLQPEYIAVAIAYVTPSPSA